MQNRLTSRDFSAEPSNIDSKVLEPRPFLRIATNLGEVLSRQSTFGSMIDLTKFGGHRDTFALLGLPQPQHRRSSSAPLLLFEALSKYLDFGSYKAIRLTCRCWSAAITCARPPRLPAVYFLPPEIIEQIYRELPPMEFNAARHTCKAWILASFDYGLLSSMLKSGGWWAAAQADIAYNQVIENGQVEEDWLLSKRLATECALLPDWTGNGLDHISTTDSFSLVSNSTREPFILTSETDFSELTNGRDENENNTYGAGLRFTTSLCGRFVLFVESCYIYVYSLGSNAPFPSPHGGHLEAVTSIVCPHRVLAVSMDTSCQKYSVGALLEGRIGFVCDLRETNHLRSNLQADVETVANLSRNAGNRAHVSSSRSLADRAVTEQAEAAEQDINGQYPGRSWSNGGTDFDSLHARRGFLHDPIAPEHTFIQQGSNILGNTSIPIETGIRSIYRNLCSEDDPPLSVAICPQRRCVAFGCSSGIELHWIDALTGQDLNRWFPLTTPSDFLYFLPPRFGVDSAKKLRLISSVSHSNKVSASRYGFYASHVGASTPLLDDLRGNGYWYSHEMRKTCDHYCAVPLSDGTHVLFTDPSTGLLCLGCDAPAGSAIKLTRNFVCQGPSGWVPMVYAAGSELRWGVRIVCAYGDRVWLYCVPGDLFAEAVEGKQVWGGMCEGHDTLGGIIVYGRQIGTLEGIMDVAIDTQGGDVMIWGFGRGGVVRCWQLNGENERCMRKRVVERDGAVRDLVDEEGDWIMRDASPLSVSESGFQGRHVRFDGQVDGWDDEGVMEAEIGDENDSGYDSDDEGEDRKGRFRIPGGKGRRAREWLSEEGEQWDGSVEVAIL